MNLKFVLIYTFYISVIAIVEIQTLDPNLKGFDDSILFKISWPGKDGVGNEIFVSIPVKVKTKIFLLFKLCH